MKDKQLMRYYKKLILLYYYMNKIVLGTMNIHYPYSSNPDTSNEYYKSIIDRYIWYLNNYNSDIKMNTNNLMKAIPILDTAYYYGNTQTEKTLGEILNPKQIIATKANPWFENDFTNGQFGQLSKAGLNHQLNTSLINLRRNKVDIFYLHCPDYETPISETLEKCDELWRTEKFDYLGISNFSKEQLLDVLTVCDKNGFNEPRYYQGMYNIICRKVEEIFPILDNYNMNFWAYNPLAGGLLTGKYTIPNVLDKSRFKDNKIYQNIFWKQEIINELDDYLKSPRCLEYSLQWLFKYSKLHENDKVILGVSTVEQLDNNIKLINKKAEYNIEEVEYLDGLYGRVKDWSPNYFY
jgi:aflatoxin B1 aldehyde reductase